MPVVIGQNVDPVSWRLFTDISEVLVAVLLKGILNAIMLITIPHIMPMAMKPTTQSYRRGISGDLD